jgi:hypothetical protein
MERRRLGEYLIADKKLTSQQLEQALSVQATRATPSRVPTLGTLLVEMGWVNQQDIAFALEQQERDERHMH